MRDNRGPAGIGLVFILIMVFLTIGLINSNDLYVQSKNGNLIQIDLNCTIISIASKRGHRCSEIVDSCVYDVDCAFNYNNSLIYYNGSIYDRKVYDNTTNSSYPAYGLYNIITHDIYSVKWNQKDVKTNESIYNSWIAWLLINIFIYCSCIVGIITIIILSYKNRHQYNNI